MQEAPPTMRADVPVDELESRLQDLDVDTALVTTPEGELIGVVSRPGLIWAAQMAARLGA